MGRRSKTRACSSKARLKSLREWRSASTRFTPMRRRRHNEGTGGKLRLRFILLGLSLFQFALKPVILFAETPGLLLEKFFLASLFGPNHIVPRIGFNLSHRVTLLPFDLPHGIADVLNSLHADEAKTA